MKRRVPLVLLFVFLVAVVWIANTDAPNSVDAKDTSIAKGTNAGLKVYLDPDTKQPVTQPVQPDLAIPAIDDALNRSTEGLTLEKSPVSGEMVNLQGRFQHHYTAGVDADGKAAVGCEIHKSSEDKNTDSEEE